jgi:hypothetical protein
MLRHLSSTFVVVRFFFVSASTWKLMRGKSFIQTKEDRRQTRQATLITTNLDITILHLKYTS